MKDWYPPRSHHQLGRADAMGQADLTCVSQNHTQNPGGPALPTSPWEQHCHSPGKKKRNQEAKTQRLFGGFSDLLAAPALAYQQQQDTALVSMCLFSKASFQASGVLATAAGRESLRKEPLTLQ